MNKDELRIRIIPEDGQVLIETHTDGIVKCKEIQEDAFLDCIKISAMQDYVNSGLLPSDCIHVKIHPNGNKEYCLWYPRLYADISYHETAYPNFPLPRLVFAFHADTEGKISGCRMGVVADERPTMETVMYRFPTSAAHGEPSALAQMHFQGTKRRMRLRVCRHSCCPSQMEITASMR